MRSLPTTADEFRRSAGLFTTGVAVLTAAIEREVRGMTANSLTSVSLEPLLLLCCLHRDSTMHQLTRDAGAFAVCILGHRQEPLARHFASPSRPSGAPQFDGIPWRPGPVTGAPLILGALAAIECRVQTVAPAGDHSIFLAEVASLHRGEQDDPLLFFRGGYRRLGPSRTVRARAARWLNGRIRVGAPAAIPLKPEEATS